MVVGTLAAAAFLAYLAIDKPGWLYQLEAAAASSAYVA
jgi:hypothetical protein